MKKTVILGTGLGIALVVSALGMSACARKAEGIDVVDHQSPVSNLYGKIRQDLVKMAAMQTDAERGAYLRKEWPNLEEGITNFLRRRGKIQENQSVQRVDFHFGSMKNIRAEGGDGEIRQGYFTDQIVARVYVVGKEKPIDVIVACLNGVYELQGDLIANTMRPLGGFTPTERFTIEVGQGLIHHVDFPTAIDLAERHNLPLYRGRTMDDSRTITPAEARALQDRTDWVQVTVYVVEGDTFDLRTGEFIRSPQRPPKS